MYQTAKKVMFSESCSNVSVPLRLGVSTGTSMKINLRPFTFFIDLCLLSFELIAKVMWDP
jgi:hypothetical protein